MRDDSEAFVAFDTSKLRNAVAIAEGGRTGEVRFLGEIENTDAATIKLVDKQVARVKRSETRGCLSIVPGLRFAPPGLRASFGIRRRKRIDQRVGRNSRRRIAPSSLSIMA